VRVEELNRSRDHMQRARAAFGGVHASACEHAVALARIRREGVIPREAWRSGRPASHDELE
jgi:hypothetical protein